MNIELKLEAQELTSTIEALRDAILRRLRWATSPQFDHWRRELPVGAVQIVMDSMVSAYTKAFMEYNDADIEKIGEFMLSFSLIDEVWDMLADVTMAESWDDIAFHEHHELKECAICRAMSGHT